MRPRQLSNPQQAACTQPGMSLVPHFMGSPRLGRIYIPLELFMRAPGVTPPAHPSQQVQLKYRITAEGRTRHCIGMHLVMNKPSYPLPCRAL